MTWYEFRNAYIELGCVSIQEVYAGNPGFDRNNFVRWTKKGYLVRLRRGIYAFSELLGKADIATYFAGKLYRPSYISLHSALSSYGLIPESILQITSVTSLKTAAFSNQFGQYTYQTVRRNLMFGYYRKNLADGHSASYATPEKALLDLLYLYPFYNTPSSLLDLRIDREALRENLDIETFQSMIVRFGSRAIENRARLFREVYEL